MPPSNPDDPTATFAPPEAGPLSLQACLDCATEIDVSEKEPLTRVPCPRCGSVLIVRGRIGPFHLEEVAGRGGMGVVYKARDAKLDRYVALKLLPKDRSGNETLIAQLSKEAAITASISHPNVVQVFSTGTDNGRFFLAMELVNNGSLEALIRAQGRISELQGLEIGIQIAQGLKAAEQRGLIHRDVKPGNILFSDAHTAKIVDFGLAIFMDEEESQRGEIWGTPYYVAPEKLDHKREDFRSDIYSLGGTLFHALAGRPPFEAENSSSVALKHLKSQPVSLQAYAPHITGSTAYVINRTLNKYPDERYQTYDELIEHLDYARTELLNNGIRSQQKRVVLESAEDRKAWGWVTAGMLLVILGMVVIGYLMRVRPETIVSKAITVPAPVTSRQTSIFDPARDKLANGNAAAAVEALQLLEQSPQLGSVERAWATYQSGIAALAAGRLEPASQAFASMTERAAALEVSEPTLALFFSPDISSFSKPSSLRAGGGKVYV